MLGSIESCRRPNQFRAKSIWQSVYLERKSIQNSRLKRGVTFLKINQNLINCLINLNEYQSVSSYFRSPENLCVLEFEIETCFEPPPPQSGTPKFESDVKLKVAKRSVLKSSTRRWSMNPGFCSRPNGRPETRTNLEQIERIRVNGTFAGTASLEGLQWKPFGIKSFW